MLSLLLFVEPTDARHGTYRAPDTGPLGTLFYSVGTMIITLPTVIITNRYVSHGSSSNQRTEHLPHRAITTPHKLPYLDAAKSLRVLLTPTERRKPWILYLTPGLMCGDLCSFCKPKLTLTLGPRKSFILPSWRWFYHLYDVYSFLR